MFTFRDFYNNQVQLSFEDHPFSSRPMHVWVICKYDGKWLLTKHKERGLEFPGGKVEEGETAKQAAVREIMEETGGLVASIGYVGQYKVDGKKETIVKNVYLATIDSLTEQETYYETAGPVLTEDLPANIRRNKHYSFVMKDGVLEKSLEYLKNGELDRKGS